MKVYPIKFEPQYHHRLWAGNQLSTELGRNPGMELAGESWELCGLENHESVVSNGLLKGKNLRELILECGEKLIGNQALRQFGCEFPLLIKFIATAKPLSVQVHPSDELAKKRHNCFGKNEMWYIMQAGDESEIIYGFKNAADKSSYTAELNNENLESILNFHKTKAGDVFYMPTGTVHAIGKDILLAEIQQSSDITYRIYDYNRIDVDGKKRELHTDLALDAINFEAKDDFFHHQAQSKNKSESLVNSDYFNTDFVMVDGEFKKDLQALDTFVVAVCLSGKGKILADGAAENFSKGETFLVPAICNLLTIESQQESKFLLVTLP